MRFQGPEGYAAGLHHLRAWHQSQLGADLSHHEDGPDSEHKGGTTSYRVPRRAQPHYLVSRQMRSPPLSTPEEGRPFRMDARGPGGT